MKDTTEQFTRILAIETSCDETAAAVVENGTEILASEVASQLEVHEIYGGIFPEVASRIHVEVVYQVVDRTLAAAHLGVDDLDCIAVTRGPGLVGSLLVGVNVAKGMSMGRGIPLLGINHLEGHIYSQWLAAEDDEIEFPIVALVISGGHTEMYLMTGHLQYEHLGGTLDDAAGEAFDKVGRLLGLSFPGGPAIDEISAEGNPVSFQFPRAVLRDGYNFSFSGLKTAVMRETRKYENGRMPVADMAASFQAAVVDVLVKKAAAAAEEFGAKAVHITGGVSANNSLREEMSSKVAIPVRFPPKDLCTDNAAMIAAAAHQRYIAGFRDSLDFDVLPSFRLA